MIKRCYSCGKAKNLDQWKPSSRMAASAPCRSCASISRKKHYQNNKERSNNTAAIYRERNKEKIAEQKKQYRLAHPEVEAARKKAHYEANKKEHHAYANARRHKTRALTISLPGEREALRSIYSHRDECRVLSGDGYHVDHIVPLKNPVVCGLHASWNLQILPQDLNDAKGNSFDPSVALVNSTLPRPIPTW